MVNKAHAFAAKAHAGVFRRWSGEPYIEHPERVAARLAALGFGPEVIAAAFLHDVVEDSGVSEAELVAEFGPKVAALVVEVSSPKVPGGKKKRVAAKLKHLAASSYAGASIKLADMIDNSANVAEHDPAFAAGYLAEMRLILPLISHGHPELVAALAKNLAK
jgi:(p)ppGpp synthase/HD superfamily hydrolase